MFRRVLPFFVLFSSSASSESIGSSIPICISSYSSTYLPLADGFMCIIRYSINFVNCWTAFISKAFQLFQKIRPCVVQVQHLPYLARRYDHERVCIFAAISDNCALTEVARFAPQDQLNVDTCQPPAENIIIGKSSPTYLCSKQSTHLSNFLKSSQKGYLLSNVRTWVPSESTWRRASNLWEQIVLDVFRYGQLYFIWQRFLENDFVLFEAAALGNLEA